MAIRNIRISTDEVLRKTCKPIKEITPNLLTLLDDMADTIESCYSGNEWFPDRRGGLLEPARTICPCGTPLLCEGKGDGQRGQ